MQDSRHEFHISSEWFDKRNCSGMTGSREILARRMSVALQCVSTMAAHSYLISHHGVKGDLNLGTRPRFVAVSSVPIPIQWSL